MIYAQRDLIAAYHDGELGVDATLEARRLIETDPEAVRYLEKLEQLDKSLRQVFDPILNEEIPLTIQSVIRRQRRHHAWIPVALAASLALVAVLVVREVAVDRALNEQLAQMQLQIAQLRNQTLENVPSGRKASWFAPAGKTRVDVMPVQTYRTSENRFCREYEERIEDAQGVEIRRGIACRSGKAVWSEEAELMPPTTRY